MSDIPVPLVADDEKTVPLTNLHTYVLPQLPNCPIPLVDQEIREVCRDFLHNTQVWGVALPAFNLVKDKVLYDLEDSQPSCSVIDRVVAVCKGTRLLKPHTDYVIASKSPYTLKLVRKPKAVTAGLTVEVVLRLKKDATTFPERIFDDWYQVLADGTMGRLMMYPGKTWTNAALGQEKLRLYNEGRKQLRIEISRGSMNVPPRARARTPFVNSGSTASGSGYIDA